jgi:hypothetical protein
MSSRTQRPQSERIEPGRVRLAGHALLRAPSVRAPVRQSACPLWAESAPTDVDWRRTGVCATLQNWLTRAHVIAARRSIDDAAFRRDRLVEANGVCRVKTSLPATCPEQDAVPPCGAGKIIDPKF